jgi:hypothetical protein
VLLLPAVPSNSVGVPARPLLFLAISGSGDRLHVSSVPLVPKAGAQLVLHAVLVPKAGAATARPWRRREIDQEGVVAAAQAGEEEGAREGRGRRKSSNPFGSFVGCTIAVAVRHGRLRAELEQGAGGARAHVDDLVAPSPRVSSSCLVAPSSRVVLPCFLLPTARPPPLLARLRTTASGSWPPPLRPCPRHHEEVVNGEQGLGRGGDRPGIGGGGRRLMGIG